MIVIHIGLPKSGSSTLQNFMSKNANREFLAANSIWYPAYAKRNNNHHNLALEVMRSNKFDPDIGTLAGLAEQWRTNVNQTMVLSSESFERLNAEAIGNLHAGLAKSRKKETFKIVMIMRDLVDLVPSSYGQKVRYGHNTFDFDEFFEARIKQDRMNDYETAARWASVFGWESMCVRALDSRSLINGDLLDDFMTMAGADLKGEAGEKMNRTGVRNAAYGWRVQEALRALYAGEHGLPKGHQAIKAAKKSGHESKDLSYIARDLGETLGWNAEKGQYLTLDQARQCHQIYSESVKALNEHLTLKLPEPRDLASRKLVERGPVLSAALIPPAELTAYYYRLGAAWFEKMEHREKKERRAEKKAKRANREAKKAERQSPAVSSHDFGNGRPTRLM